MVLKMHLWCIKAEVRFQSSKEEGGAGKFLVISVFLKNLYQFKQGDQKK